MLFGPNAVFVVELRFELKNKITNNNNKNNNNKLHVLVLTQKLFTCKY